MWVGSSTVCVHVHVVDGGRCLQQVGRASALVRCALVGDRDGGRRVAAHGVAAYGGRHRHANGHARLWWSGINTSTQTQGCTAAVSEMRGCTPEVGPLPTRSFYAQQEYTALWENKGAEIKAELARETFGCRGRFAIKHCGGYVPSHYAVALRRWHKMRSQMLYPHSFFVSPQNPLDEQWI